MERQEYKGYTIDYWGKHRGIELWTYTHEDYDGAPDSGDQRCGLVHSLKKAKEDIDFIEDSQVDEDVLWFIKPGMWVARDSIQGVWVFNVRPEFDQSCWSSVAGEVALIDDNPFPREWPAERCIYQVK